MRYVFRAKLVAGILIMLAMIVGMGVTTYRASIESRHLIERARLAHEVLERLSDLSTRTTAVMHELQHLAELGAGRVETAIERSRGAVDEAAEAARQAVVREVEAERASDPTGLRGEVEELEALRQLQQDLQRVYWGLARVDRMFQEGEKEQASNLLAVIEGDWIEKQLEPLLTRMIAHEREEVEESDNETADYLRRASTINGMLAAASGLVGSVLTFRLLKEFGWSMTMLLAGTERLAAGDFGFRLEGLRDDEFGRIGNSINAIAAELEQEKERVAQTHASLDRQVSERTRELAEANRQLQDWMSERKRFFADVSHELRTPLTVLRGESEIALRGQPKPIEEYQATLRRIVEQSERMSSLVDDMLLVARAESGELRLQLRSVDLAHVMREVQRDAETLGRTRSVTVDLRMSEARIPIVADPGRIVQLFMAILHNAVSYSHPETAVSIEVDVVPEGVSVIVRDSGIGIAPGELDMVFKRFYRGQNTATRIGTGLGLSVALAIAEAHGGTIDIESTIGKGTEVTVTLPVHHETRATT